MVHMRRQRPQAVLTVSQVALRPMACSYSLYPQKIEYPKAAPYVWHMELVRFCFLPKE